MRIYAMFASVRDEYESPLYEYTPGNVFFFFTFFPLIPQASVSVYDERHYN